jgi:hypothetical protein
MTNKEYADYVRQAAARGEKIYPKDHGTPPKVFGTFYAGSSKKRKNDILRKRLN